MKPDTPQDGRLEELLPTRRSLLDRLRNLEDHASWQEFFDTYWKLIYRAAVKAGLPDGEAEDIVQETVIGVARRMETFRYDPGQCSFKGWLMHVTRRRIIDHFRRHQRRPACSPLPEDGGTGGTGLEIADRQTQTSFESLWDEEWQRHLVESAMQHVKRSVRADHYQIFYLHSVKGMPARDIRALMGVSAAKIYVVHHRVAQLVKREVRRLGRASP